MKSLKCLVLENIFTAAASLTQTGSEQTDTWFCEPNMWVTQTAVQAKHRWRLLVFKSQDKMTKSEQNMCDHGRSVALGCLLLHCSHSTYNHEIQTSHLRSTLRAPRLIPNSRIVKTCTVLASGCLKCSWKSVGRAEGLRRNIKVQKIVSYFFFTASTLAPEGTGCAVPAGVGSVTV